MRLPSSASASSSSVCSSPTEHNSKLRSPYSPLSKQPRRRMEKGSFANFKSGCPLQRGSACLSCRKRKMKCDAGKPSCGQCVKANRSLDCDYDDGKSKSRTQILQDKITQLESRIRELEGADCTTSCPSAPRYDMAPDPTPSILYDPIVPGVFGDNAPFDISLPRLAVSSGSTSPPGSPWVHGLQIHTSENLQWSIDPHSMTPEDLLKSSGRWWEHSQPPQHIKQLLVDIFLPHHRQCGLEIDPTRFRSSLESSDPPHPALLNAMYALACHFSLSLVLSPHEPRFVARALRGISEALETSEKLIDVLQASCLLAVLFFIKGRLIEGYYHVGAAARLVIGLGLHQITPPKEWALGSRGSPSSSSSSASQSTSGSSIFPPPADWIELGERILTFWQVFSLDRCWAVATCLPVALSDDIYLGTRIETPWPRSLEDYEMGRASEADHSAVSYLYSQVTTLPFSAHDSTNALRAKATTLFERASRLSSTFGTPVQTAEHFWADFQSVDVAISQLSVSVPPARAEPGERTDPTLFGVHALLHAATIQLHAPFALKDVASQQKSAGAAALATAMIHELENADYAFLDPIMGTCWTCVAEALVREVIALRAASAAEQVTALERQLDAVTAAMNRLGSIVPLAAYQASKIAQSRDVIF